jgi:hypothetical protein
MGEFERWAAHAAVVSMSGGFQMTRERRVALTAVAVLALSTIGRAQQPAVDAVATGNLKVTVDYKGQGTVDADHRLFIWVFDTPNITAESMPIGTGVIKENSGSYKFVGLPKDVYLAVAFDEKGGFDGASAPSPGTPVAIHGVTTPGGPGAPVGTGDEDAKIIVTFDDSIRMP